MTWIWREIPATGVEYAVPSFEVSSSLQLLQSLHAMAAMRAMRSLRAMPALHAMHAMQPGRGVCNDATTSAKVIDRVVESHWELVPRTHLSLVRRCRR